jgi:hypothetical protein
MKAIISSTYDDLYFFFLPIITWSWNKIGVTPIIILPIATNDDQRRRDLTIFIHSELAELKYNVIFYSAPAHKEATYAQCSRLYASAIDTLPEDEILITGDIDMAVFNKEYFNQANNDQINIFGVDLVPANQYPICYISMPVKTWRHVMWITPGVPVQKYLDELLGHLECDHFKGNYWAKDQETIFNYLERQAWPVVKHKRAKHPHQFATRRADRDGWPDALPPDIIDAHLPRPGYTEENFAKILKLFQDVYPDEDFTWMVEYRNEYLKFLL